MTESVGAGTIYGPRSRPTSVPPTAVKSVGQFAEILPVNRKAPIRAYFLGSGAVGIPALDALARSDELELVGIGTQPDRPAGRKRRLRETEIGSFAADCQLTVDKPASVNAPDFLARLRSLSPDICVVAAYGQILKGPILSLPRHGCVNIHASLLPRHRGAAPISAAVLAGDTETGVSFMQMDEGLDTGPVYQQTSIGLVGSETTATLTERLGELAGSGIVECVTSICRGSATAVPQDPHGATYAPRLRKAEARMDWQQSAALLDRCVRAYYPWPRAFFAMPSPKRARCIQVTRTTVADSSTACEAGRVLRADRDAWVIACGQGALELIKIIPEGKGEMLAVDFLRGCPCPPGVRLPLPE